MHLQREFESPVRTVPFIDALRAGLMDKTREFDASPKARVKAERAKGKGSCAG